MAEMDSRYYFQGEQKQNQHGITFHRSLDPQDDTVSEGPDDR